LDTLIQLKVVFRAGRWTRTRWETRNMCSSDCTCRSSGNQQRDPPLRKDLQLLGKAFDVSIGDGSSSYGYEEGFRRKWAYRGIGNKKVG